MKTYFFILLAAMISGCGGTPPRSAADSKGKAPAADSAGRWGGRSGAVDFPQSYSYRVVKVYPHEEDAYTQGLFWHDGYLWEGTGGYGNSSLRKTDLSTGRTVASRALGPEYFGEGIALLDGKIYQLTWNEGTAFVYDAASLRLLKTLRYDGEGWGITTDGEVLYTSDGTEVITVRDARSFVPLRRINVHEGSARLRLLNELEWIDGEIWANVYLSDRIVRIDPLTGRVTGSIDLTGLQSESDRTPVSDVLNGIAYDPDGGRILVTGKNWNKIYEVEIIKTK